MAGYIGSGASVVSSGVENKKVFDITTNTTSLTGLNYTVGKVHVYHNGVRLVDGTDFTATNSTSIALTVAAVSGDQVVVVSFASYQVALSGIDDQSNAVAMTIDSSENVMVGTTTSTGFQSSSSATGTIAYSGGTIASNVSGDAAAYFNRLSSDGAIVSLRKNGSTVGSVGTGYGVVDIKGGTSGLLMGNTAVLPVNGSGTLTTDSYDIGAGSFRFKDLYLSGGVYLGGTAASNKLNQYEYGAWSPTFSASGYTFQYNAGTAGRYVKIGRLVHINGYIRLSHVPSGSGSVALNIAGLPYNASNANSSSYTAGSMIVEASGSIFSGIPTPRLNRNSTTFYIMQNREGQSPLFGGINVAGLTSSMEFEFQFTYQTDS